MVEGFGFKSPDPGYRALAIKTKASCPIKASSRYANGNPFNTCKVMKPDGKTQSAQRLSR
jgi:hypothetical protein